MANAGGRGRPIAPLVLSVERWVVELTRKRLRRGVHTSVRQLEADIRSFIDRHNHNPRPFKWTKICRSNPGFSQTLLPQSAADIMQRTLDSRD